MTPTIFVVDDEEDIRTSLARALSLRGYQVSTFDSAETFLAAYDGIAPGCLILDYGMPKMNGLELQEHLANKRIDIPIIFITGHGGIPESVQAIKAGAIDFLEKPFKQAHLLERIETALSIDTVAREVRRKTLLVKTRYDTLTDREREIAHLMADNPSSVSSKEIARALDISPRTVDHHRARILEKMMVRSVAELVETFVTAGLNARQAPGPDPSSGSA